MSRWERIGKCAVDSGQIVIMDPCYIRSEVVQYPSNAKSIEAKKMIANTDKFLGEASRVTIDNPGGQLYFDRGHEGLAVGSRTGAGDGIYNVFVKRDGHLVKELKIVFIRDESNKEDEVMTGADSIFEAVVGVVEAIGQGPILLKTIKENSPKLHDALIEMAKEQIKKETNEKEH